MEKIVDDQRTLLMDVFNTTDLTTVPQVWTLCTWLAICYTLLVANDALDKEVQQYYDEGMPVPDDVILMWTDDK